MFKYDPNTKYAFYAEDFETDLVMAYDFNAEDTAESYGEELCKAILSELGLDVPEDGACEALAKHYNREDIRARVRENYKSDTI